LKITVSRDELLGILSLLGGVGLFSTVEIASKIIGPRVDPVVLTFLRFSLTGIVLIIICIPMLRLRLSPLKGKDFGIFLLNGLIGIALGITLFHIAILTMEKAASAAVVFSVNPVFVILLSRFVNKEPWRLHVWAAAGFGVLGVSFFAYESGAFLAVSLQGLGLMLLAAFFFALSVCISRRVVGDYGAMMLAGFSALFGSMLLAPLAWYRFPCGGIGQIAGVWLPVAYVVVFGTVLAYVLYYFGILNTSAQKASLAFFLKPVLASVLAALILGEKINGYMITGTILVLCGLIVTVFGSFLNGKRS
jgi:drug/metabolite transporter (DMT)-like permease